MPAIPINPALIIAGPCLIQQKGATFFSKGNVQVNVVEDPFILESSAHGEVAEGEASKLVEVSFTPVGVLDALDQLFPARYKTFTPGTLVHNVKTLGAIDLDTNIITITGHQIRDGEAVRLASFGTLPAPLAAATLYYFHALSANTGTLHASEAAALANTGVINITDAGTGTHRIIEQPYLVVHSMTTLDRYQFHNSALTKMPGLKCAATESALKDLTYTCYRKHAIDPEDAAAFYTKTNAALPATNFDPDDIITAVSELQWGEDAPWSSMSTKAGVDIDFAMSLTPVTDDAGGIVSHRIEKIEPTATAAPNNVDEDAIYAKRLLQGTGSGRGKRKSGDDLHIVGDDLYVIIYNSVIKESPLNYDGKEDRVGDIQWSGKRKFTAGVLADIFYVGEEAPV